MFATVFAEAIDRLAPEAFLRHFLVRDTVRYPDPPRATPAALWNADKVLANRFELVGEEYVLPARFSWKESPSRDKEWQIAHHKFYFAVDLIQAYRHRGDRAYLERWVALIESWLGEMGSGYITASDAQVEAKRVEHWVRSFMLLRGTPCETVVSPRFVREFLTRVVTETLYIADHLKPVRNHRTFQLFTVFMVGVLFPEFRSQARFLELGRTKLTESFLTDFLTDGVHAELSTHYHQLVLETALAFVELARLNGVELDPALEPRLARALEFSMHVQLPDGGIPLLNDSDNGDHLAMLAMGGRLFGDERLAWAATLGRAGQPPSERARHFDQSGYFVFCDGWGSDPASYARRQHVVYDCARLGEGSHSHYDLFTFCYHAGGAPAIIDPGRYTYSAAPDADGIDWRHRFKSTASHNTVAIDGKDQTRYISKHQRVSANPGDSRVKHGPDVEVLDTAFYLGAETDWVWAAARSHEYTPLHRRLFVFFRQQYLFVFDHVQMDDGAQHECALRFHLAPRWRTLVSLETTGDMVSARAPLFDVRSVRAPGMEIRLERGWASETYGVKERAPVLALTQRGRQPLFFCSVVAPRAAAGHGFETRALHVVADDGDALLFRVDGTAGDERVADWFFIARSGAPALVQSPFGPCHAQFMAWRNLGSGPLAYLCASRVAGGAWPPGTSMSVDDIEWSAASTR
jgi:heparinase II/III-like protein